MTFIDRLFAWTWAKDWRTWLAHFVLVGLWTVLWGLVGYGGTAALIGASYYAGREKIVEGGEYTTDRIMDAVSAAVGAFLGWWVLR